MKSLLTRLVDVVLAPGQAFSEIGAGQSRWDMLAVSIVAVGCLVAGLWLSPTGQRLAAADRQKILELAYERVPPNQLEAVLAKLEAQPSAPVMRRAWGAVWQWAVGLLAISAVLHFGLTVLLLNREVRYWAVVGVCSHASVPALIGLGTSVLLTILTGEQKTTTLPSLLPFVAWPESGLVYELLGHIDPFSIWGIGLAAVGLGRLFRQSTGIILSFLFAVWLIMVGVGTAVGFLAGGAGGGVPWGHGS